MSATKEISYKEVATHNTAADCWVIIGDGVYNLTEQMKTHPPGPFMIKLFAGKEATWLFNKVLLHSEKVFKNKEKYRVGTIKRVPGESIPNNAEVFIALFLLFLGIAAFFLLKWFKIKSLDKVFMNNVWMSSYMRVVWWIYIIIKK